MAEAIGLRLAYDVSKQAQSPYREGGSHEQRTAIVAAKAGLRAASGRWRFLSDQELARERGARDSRTRASVHGGGRRTNHQRVLVQGEVSVRAGAEAARARHRRNIIRGVRLRRWDQSAE